MASFGFIAGRRHKFPSGLRPVSWGVHNMMVIGAQHVIAQHLDHPAVRNLPAGALVKHPLQLCLQRTQAGDAGTGGGKLGIGDHIDGGARLIRPVRQAQQIANGFKRKTQLPRVSDESKPVEGGLGI